MAHWDCVQCLLYFKVQVAKPYYNRARFMYTIPKITHVENTN